MAAQTVSDSLRALTNITAVRNQQFRGRTDVLATIRDVLQQQGMAWLCNPSPGLGKTSLALEYAYRYMRDYEVIWRCRAEHPPLITAAFDTLGDRLGLPAATDGNAKWMVNEVRRWLEDNDRWLLIFDDVADAADLEPFLPSRPGGHIIVTAAMTHRSGDPRSIRVGPVSRQTAIEILTSRSDRSDDHSADELAESMSDAPLVLELAAIYARVSNRQFFDVSQQIFSRLTPAEQAKFPVIDLRGHCRAVMSLLLDFVREDAEDVAGLLNLCAFMAPEDVPLTLPRDGASALPKSLRRIVTDVETYKRSVNLLRYYRLMKLSGGGLHVHPIIQQACQQLLTEQQRKAWAGIALTLVRNAFPEESQYTHILPACTRLLPHIHAVTAHAEKFDIRTEETGELLDRVGLYLHGCGEFTEATTFYSRSIQLARKLHGEINVSVARRMNNLGVLLQEQNKHEEAEGYFERAIAIFTKMNGRMHESLEMPMRNLCQTLIARKAWDKAREQCGEAMDLFLEHHRFSHPLVSECANNLGRIWLAEGSLRKAVQCFEKAVFSAENAVDLDEERLASYLTDLGAALVKQKKPDKARPHFERAMNLFDGAAPHSQRHVGMATFHLGRAAREQENFEEAITHYKRSLEAYELSGRDSTREIIKVLKELGKVHLQQEYPQEAKKCYERLFALRLEAYGPDSEDLVDDLMNLGRAASESEAFEEAHEYFNRALELSEKFHGKQSAQVATVLHRFGRSLQSSGEHQESIQMLQRSAAINAATRGKEHVLVGKDNYYLGLAYGALGDTVVSLSHLNHASRIVEERMGREHALAREIRDRIEELNG